MAVNTTALLVIDVQQGLFNKTTPVYKADALLDNLDELIGRAHGAGACVIYVQHSNESFLVKDSPGWRLHPRLHPAAGDLIIHKTHGSAFEDTTLGDELAKRGITRLVICGLVTHGCVKAGTLDAVRLGYQTTLVSDAHSSYSKDAPRLIEQWNGKLAQAGAHLAATQDVQF